MKILIFGLNGLGSELVKNLVEVGFENFTLIDD
jgi:molybdopterin/thiamine biosynthesis adenylyltransferase